MDQFLTLLERDFRNAPWRRLGLGAVLILLFQLLTAVASGAPEKHRIEWPAAFFFLWIFGFLAAIGLSYDRISSERESRALDLLLTSGVPRLRLVASKVLVVLLLAAVLGATFFAATTVVYVPFVGVRPAMTAWRHLSPVCALLAVYALFSLACSTVFRTSKGALLAAFSFAVAGRPKIYEGLIEGISRLFGLGQHAKAVLLALCPEIALVHLTGVGPNVGERQPGLAWLVLMAPAGLAATLAVVVFMRQDEPTHGE